jgi:tetratricopeptide (TPR) repeat protein
MALGCQSLDPHRKNQDSNQWICSEFADALLRQGRFEEAIEQHLKVLSQEPDNGLAHYHLGYAHGQLGLHVGEIAEYSKAVDLGLVRGDLFYNLGMAYMEVGEYGRAEQAFHQAIELEPEFSENHLALGLVHYKLEHFQEAIIACRQATILADDNPDAWHCLALASARADQIGESWNAVERLRKLDPAYRLDPFLLELFSLEGESH